MDFEVKPAPCQAERLRRVAMNARSARLAAHTAAMPPALSGDGRSFGAAYLVTRGDVERFKDAVDEHAAGDRGLQLLCTGPWPPYSFVEWGMSQPAKVGDRG